MTKDHAATNCCKLSWTLGIDPENGRSYPIVTFVSIREVSERLPWCCVTEKTRLSIPIGSWSRLVDSKRTAGKDNSSRRAQSKNWCSAKRTIVAFAAQELQGPFLQPTICRWYNQFLLPEDLSLHTDSGEGNETQLIFW
ncbi:hypothetical protein Bbelb_268830 [Branchiostoma belcheri]|nr:hypothetical protein Bbelb_268830 [Branchiostoma belcheri]